MLTFIMRHGNTEWNAHGKVQGQTDIPLNDLGRKQARGNAELLRAFPEFASLKDELEILASPLGRARDSAAIVAEALGFPLSSVRYDKRLMEFGYGLWEGLTQDEIRQRFPREFEARMASPWETRVPEGESLGEVRERFMSCLDSLTRPTLVVSHGGAIRCFFAVRGYIPEDAPLLGVIPQDTAAWR